MPVPAANTGHLLRAKVTCRRLQSRRSTMPTLPSCVMLYIPMRAGANRFILMDVVQEETPPVWKLTPVATPTFTLKLASPEVITSMYIGRFVMRTTDGILLNKNVRSHPGIVITNAANEVIPVISISMHTHLFGAHKLKTNVVLTLSSPPVTIAPPPALAPLALALALAPSTPPTVAAPAMNPVIVKKKKHMSLPVQGHGVLEKFVAKQLLDLAILRKETCPITAEEFSEGHTAAMPCGHLFMQFAIEESFKKENNKCPWCRQLGSPTYV